MKRTICSVAAGFGLLAAASQAAALSFSASTGSDYQAVEASQAILPRVRANVGYVRADHSRTRCSRGWPIPVPGY